MNVNAASPIPVAKTMNAPAISLSFIPTVIARVALMWERVAQGLRDFLALNILLIKNFGQIAALLIWVTLAATIEGFAGHGYITLSVIDLEAIVDERLGSWFKLCREDYAFVMIFFVPIYTLC